MLTVHFSTFLTCCIFSDTILTSSASCTVIFEDTCTVDNPCVKKWYTFMIYQFFQTWTKSGEILQSSIIAYNSVALITSVLSSSGIQGLMEDVEDVNKVNYLGQTALHKAASGM